MAETTDKAELAARAERLRLELEKIAWMDEFLDASGAKAMMQIARDAVKADEALVPPRCDAQSAEPVPDDFDGIGWREYMRGVENGNIDPTGVRLRALCKIARENLEALDQLADAKQCDAQSVREATIEECAKVCDLHAEWAIYHHREDEAPESSHNQLFATIGNTASACAGLIRALSKPAQGDGQT